MIWQPANTVSRKQRNACAMGQKEKTLTSLHSTDGKTYVASPKHFNTLAIIYLFAKKESSVPFLLFFVFFPKEEHSFLFELPLLGGNGDMALAVDCC